MHVYSKTKETTFLLHCEMRCDRQRNFAVVMAITFLVPRVVAFITFFGFFFFAVVSNISFCCHFAVRRLPRLKSRAIRAYSRQPMRSNQAVSVSLSADAPVFSLRFLFDWGFVFICSTA